MFMNSLCMALYVLAIFKPAQVIQTHDFCFGGEELNLSNACRGQNE